MLWSRQGKIDYNNIINKVKDSLVLELLNPRSVHKYMLSKIQQS
jgi:hypothetical protein